jgi:hypothetical protein
MGYVRKDYLQHGTYAERLSAPERTLAHKPPSLASMFRDLDVSG